MAFPLSQILSLIETTFTVGALIVAIMTIRANTQERKIETVHATYDNFQDLHLALMSDEAMLRVLAELQQESLDGVRKQYLGSILINNAYKTFYLHQEDQLPPQLWECSVIDMKGLFAIEFISQQWHEKKRLFPDDFQEFIRTIILPTRPLNQNQYEVPSSP